MKQARPRPMLSLRHLGFALPRAVAIGLAAAITLAAPDASSQGAAKPAQPAAKPDPKKAAEDAKKAEEQKKADDAKADDAKAEEQKKADDAAKAAPAPAPVTSVEPPHEDWDIKDVTELPGKRYMFIGARYRGNIIPQFMLNLFVDEGATIYSNSFGLELELRKDGFSLIPALSFTEYGTGDILFKQKGEKDIPGNYSFVNSSMKALYATADLLWSVPISKNFEFEYGAGFGLGIIFGDLRNNWVYRDDMNGTLDASNGGKYAKCAVGGTQPGCNAAEHKNTDILKIGDYKEPSWLDGGSKPVIFPWISIPQFGLRYKPVKNFVARLGIGFALTGFWFGLNGAYGLEQKPKP